MKNPINSGVFIAIVASLVLIVAALMFWVWRAPSVSVAADASGASSGGSEARKSRAAEMMAEMKAAHSAPSPEERRQKEEWRQAHPDGYTKR